LNQGTIERGVIRMCPEPIQTLKSETTPQEWGATGNSLEKTKAMPALPPERPKLRGNILPKIPTPDMRSATLEARLVNAGVPRDPDFIHGLLGQLITAGDMAGSHDDHETGFLFSVMEGVAPRDVIEAMIGSHLGMLQGLIANQVRVVNRTNDPALRDVAVNTLGKLIRTFTAVSDALTRRTIVRAEYPLRGKAGEACKSRRATQDSPKPDGQTLRPVGPARWGGRLAFAKQKGAL
jgi:hypothetical protein